MSKPVISQDTEIMQVEQMVYDALTEINESMTNVIECDSMGNLYDMVMSGFTVYDEDVVTVEMVKRIREEWVSDMKEIEQLERVEVKAVDDIRQGATVMDASQVQIGFSVKIRNSEEIAQIHTATNIAKQIVQGKDRAELETMLEAYAPNRNDLAQAFALVIKERLEYLDQA